MALTYEQVWGRVRAGPPTAQHQLLAEFGLSLGRFEARPLPDPRVPGVQVPPPPLRVPWLPLAQLTAGPGELRRLKQRLRHGVGAVPGARDVAIVITSFTPLRDAAEESWNAERFEPLVDAGEAARTGIGLAFAILVLGLLSHFAGAGHKPNLARHTAARRAAARLYLAASAVSVATLLRSWFTWAGLAPPFISELLFALTDGEVAVWPSDMRLEPASGVFLCTAGAGLASICGFALLAEPEQLVQAATQQARSEAKCTSVRDWKRSLSEEAPVARAVVKPQTIMQSRRMRRGTTVGVCGEAPTLEDKEGDVHDAILEGALDDADAQLYAQGRRLAGCVSAILLLLVVSLSITAWLWGRVAVEENIHKALRGPPRDVRKLSRSLRRLDRDLRLGARSAQAAASEACRSLIASARRGGRRAATVEE